MFGDEKEPKRNLFDDATEKDVDEPLPEVEKSFLGHFFKDKAFNWADSSEQAEAVLLQPDGQLTFNQGMVDQRTREFMEEMLESLVEGLVSDPPVLTGTMAWYFEDQPREFLEALKDELEIALGRKPADDARLSSIDLDMRKKLEGALEFFKDQSRKEFIRKTYEAQMPLIPIAEIWATNPITKEQVKLDYDPARRDNSADVRFMFVNNNGQPEVMMVCRREGFVIDGLVPTHNSAAEWEAAGHFSMSVRKVTDSNQTDGFDGTNYELTVGQGGANQAPIFSTVRIFTHPFNLDKQIDELVRERQQKEALEQAQKRQQQQQQSQPSYFGQPPTAPSKPSTPPPPPRFEQPISYVSSG